MKKLYRAVAGSHRLLPAFVVALAFALLGPQAAYSEGDEQPQAAAPTVVQFTEYARLDVQLAKCLPDGKSVTLRLGWHGTGGFRQAWIDVEGVKVISDAINADGLELEGDRLTGKVEIAELRDGSGSGLACEFILDAKVEGGKVTGTYKGWTAERLVDGRNIVYLGDGLVVGPDQVRWKRDNKKEVNGSLSGTAGDADAAAKGQGFAEGPGWPHHRGPNDDWSIEAPKSPLIDDMRDAQLVWKSETTPPARSQVTRYGEGNVVRFLERGLAGGGASPAFADGRVYFHYYEPSGKAYSESTVASQIKGDRHTILDMWKTNATDVVLCLDASTGKTLWKAEIPGGRYYPAMSGRMGSTKGWYAPHLAVAEGRVFVSTTADVTWCFDAESGKVQWHKKTPMAAVRTVIDGVLLPSGRDLIGYDAATGKQLWKIEGANSDVRAPLRWRHEDKNYAITGNRHGTIICVEPKTGKELWRLTDAGDNEDSLYLAGDYLLVNVTPEKKRGEPKKVPRLGAYKLSTAKPQKAWELGEKHVYGGKNRPVIANDGFVLLRHDDKSGKAVVVKIDTGEITKELSFPSARGFLYRVGDRLILQRDVSHSVTELFMYSFRLGELRAMGELWPTLHTPTSGYWPLTISHAIADGRIFIRGSRGIFCYDLRRTKPPVFDPPGAKASEPVSLKLSHPDPRVTVRYAFDGKEPTEKSPVYTEPLKITETRIIKAKAWHPLFATSSTQQAVIYFGESDKAQPPQIVPEAGTYERDLNVRLTTPTRYATIRYTLDGSEPTDRSPVYAGPFVLAKSATLKAKTFCGYLPDSEAVTARYIVQRRPFVEDEDRIVMEAENFFTQKQADKNEWKATDETGASGKVIDATPDSGAKHKSGQGPRLDYPLLVDKPGSFYLWVRWRGRSSSSDSIYVGLNRRVLGEFGNVEGSFTWQRLGGEKPTAIKVAQAGQNTFHVWMREDGTLVDKIVLTRDPKWEPSDTGPDESPRKDED